VVALAAFAYVAFQVAASGRGDLVAVAARVEQAKAQAAADGGLMLAIQALGAHDLNQRWPIDGTAREAPFAGADLSITVEDERGKVPLQGLNPDQVRSLFAGAGADGDRLDALVQEMRQFQSGEDETPPDPNAPPAESLAGWPVREGSFRMVGDLMALKDMDADLYVRLAPSVTTFFEESGPFDRPHAGPLAIAAMDADMPPPGSEAAQEDQADQPSEDENEAPVDENLIGRTLTVKVVAHGRAGAIARRTAIVELTGDPQKPYWIRYTE
jgi:general secretion pathway protein K